MTVPPVTQTVTVPPVTPTMTQTTGATMGAVAVCVPARNEQTLLPACLASVRAALSRHPGAEQLVVVTAHRCTDRTATVAAAALTGLPHLILVDDTSRTVAEVRNRAARAALDALSVPPASTWLLSTDADSLVPIDWIATLRRHAAQGVRAVAGLADVDLGELAEPARSRYRAIVAAGIHGRTHEHVYGANLAVRADAYLSVGGFPPVALGEDTALVTTLEDHEIPVARATDVIVTTSGRVHGRAPGGLADLLARLGSDGSPLTASGPAGGPLDRPRHETPA